MLFLWFLSITMQANPHTSSHIFSDLYCSWLTKLVHLQCESLARFSHNSSFFIKKQQKTILKFAHYT